MPSCPMPSSSSPFRALRGEICTDGPPARATFESYPPSPLALFFSDVILPTPTSPTAPGVSTVRFPDRAMWQGCGTQRRSLRPEILHPDPRSRAGGPARFDTPNSPRPVSTVEHGALRREQAIPPGGNERSRPANCFTAGRPTLKARRIIHTATPRDVTQSHPRDQPCECRLHPA
jgi:hypothetical protein